MLEIEVHDIKGTCPVYKKRDKISIKNPNIVMDKTDALCAHALPTILHYALILEYSWCPLKLGLTKEDDQDHAYFQCLDPGKPYTMGGKSFLEQRIRTSNKSGGASRGKFQSRARPNLIVNVGI